MNKKLRKWNWKTHKYEDFEIPATRRPATYAYDMDTHIDCASCGVSVAYGLTYTSMEIHTEMGIGYCVCQECFEEECKRAAKFRREKYHG